MTVQGPIPGIQGPGGIDPTRRPDPTPGEEKGEFARILEELRRLDEVGAKETGTGAGGDSIDPADLVRRIDEADESFRKAMEIRRNLEEAWNRARNPYQGD